MIAGGASLAPRRWSLLAVAIAGAQQVRVQVDRADDRAEEHQELQVGVRFVLRVEQVDAGVG